VKYCECDPCDQPARWLLYAGSDLLFRWGRAICGAHITVVALALTPNALDHVMLSQLESLPDGADGTVPEWATK